MDLNNVFYSTHINSQTIVLEDQEARHCAVVLRKKVGNTVHIIDGKGSRYECLIDTISKNKVSCTIQSVVQKAKTENITIAIAPTKNRDRLEWMVEKLVEIGVEAIVLMRTENTERTRTNMVRVNKKILSAVKQSLRFYIPSLLEMSFNEILELEHSEKYIAHCYDESDKSPVSGINQANKLILIGPEGDFTLSEVTKAFEAQFMGLDLGDYRLRTETAAIVAVSIFQ